MDTFSSAAAGNAADQESMCQIALGSPDPFRASAPGLWGAFIWANMALANGQLSIRPLRAQILMALADRTLADGSVPDRRDRAMELLTDALAHLYELDAEKHPGAATSIAAFLPGLADTFGERETVQIIAAARSVASRRVMARLADPFLGTSAPITFH